MKKMIMIGGIAFVVLIIVAVVLFVFVFNKSDKPKPIVYLEYQLGEQYTNIKDEKKILKFECTIEYTDSELETKFNENKSKIISSILELFRTKSYEDIMKANGQERISEEIRERVIEILESDSDTITNVYFLQFIVQG